jgi:phosphatidate cytidylyltransferase
MIAGVGFMLWMLNDAYIIAGFRLHELGWWILIVLAIALPIAEILFSKNHNPKMMAHSFFGLLYISLSWGLMMGLRNNGMVFSLLSKVNVIEMPSTSLFFDFGYLYPILLIASIWINDTMAYIVGSLIGKTPLSKISPKKTWEGTVGGAILAIVAVSCFGYFVLKVDLKILIGISSIGAIIGTIGDLLESKLKRLAGVKDSGSFMPGHGGFLDRFDSLILATPFVWLYLKLIL